jgi:hypothetical protein
VYKLILGIKYAVSSKVVHTFTSEAVLRHEVLMRVSIKVMVILNMMLCGSLDTFWKNLLLSSSVWNVLLCWYLANKSHGIRFQISLNLIELTKREC